MSASRKGFVTGRPARNLVAVVLGLVRAVHRHAEVFGLCLAELGQLHTDLLEVETGDFFVELLGQTIDRLLVLVLVLPKVDLRERLVGEGV